MKKAFTIVCRGSWLSLAQAEIFKEKVYARFPDVKIEVVIQETAGDREQSVPLHLVEGKDFFTKDIQDFLRSGQADLAVHSMKDVSSEGFFKQGHFGIIDREDLRDVAIFNESIVGKLKRSEKIIIGTSSPRRSNMATAFLQKALPKYGQQNSTIEAIPIRGNVDTRLQKLSDGQYDGIILAVAGLNRLLNYVPAKEKVGSLLRNKKIMVLPLFECPPAAGQGAIVAETTNDNQEAIVLLQAIKNKKLTLAIQRERAYAYHYGYGCSQQFGTFHLDLPNISFTYAAGKDKNNTEFTEWEYVVTLNVNNKRMFSSTEYMKDFFAYRFLDEVTVDANAKAFFVSSHKAIHSASLAHAIREKKVWAAGTRTWLELAKKGIWVDGCADGLGLEFIQRTFGSPLICLEKNEVQVLTNSDSLYHRLEEGWNALPTYELVPRLSKKVVKLISQADIIFWTSFQQYQLCKNLLKSRVEHCCLPGKTAKLLLQLGIYPVVFPTIKAFNEWRKKHFIVTTGE